MDLNHGNLNHIRGSPLNGGIHGDPLPERTLHKVSRGQLRYGSSPSKQSGHIAVVLCSLYRPVQEIFHSRISGKILLDILAGLLFGDAEPLAQPERADAVHNPEIHRLGIAALQISNLVKRNMENLRSRNPVNIRMHFIGVYELFVLGHMGQNPELNLRIVGVRKNTPLLRNKHLSDFSPQLCPHGNVLQIGVGRADSTCCGDSLVKGSVNPLIFPDKGGKPVRIGGF